MLGKGLESLIPQKNNQGGTNDGGNSGDSAAPKMPSGGMASFVPKDAASKPPQDGPKSTPPPISIPVLQDELDLPKADDELALPFMEEAALPAQAVKLTVEPEKKAEERKEPAASFALDNKPVDPVASRLTQSSITVAARNVNVGGPAGTYESLIPSKNTDNSKSVGKDPAIAASVFHIETEKIMPNSSQPRRHFDENALKDLAYSIREFGILQPLVVTRVKKETPHGVNVEYELIAGERRLLASKMIGLKTVPAIIRNIDLEREKLELAIIENLQREALNPLETARAFERLRDEFKLTQREIAAKLGKSREVVANTVRLLDLPTFAQEALEKGQLSESNARFLLAIEDSEAQKKLFDDIVQRGLTTRDVKDRVAQLGKRGRGRPPGSANASTSITPELKAIQDELSSELGAPVEIEKKANTGKITITFYSQEELDNILKKMGKE